MNFENKVVEGDKRPSSDTKTHAWMYKNSEKIGGIAHTHATYSVAWAGAAGHPHLWDDPCRPPDRRHPYAEPMRDDLIEGNYEHNTDIQITDCFRERDLHYEEVPMILIGNHGPFTWGKDAARPFTTAKYWS